MTDSYIRYLVGDTLTALRTMPDVSVDLVLTSPPFLGLRSYLPADDPAKAHEMGSEATPGEFIDALLEVVEECGRVLAPHGSIAFELGDTYSSPGGTTDARESSLGGNDFAPRATRGGGHGWPLDKSLCLIPELFRISLVYGFNPLTGRPTPRWRARNVVRWCRPNPPVGALADKFRPATSEMVIACVGRKRYFDLDAVRVPFTGHGGAGTGVRKGQNGAKPEDGRPGDMPTMINTHDGAPPLDWWEIPTSPYPGSHFATFPPALCVRPIEAMCPRRVCTACGRPSERIVDVAGTIGPSQPTAGRNLKQGGPMTRDVDLTRTTTGWTDCGHDAWRAGVVLDPFAGSGTTLQVAHGHGRSAIGIDLDIRNVELARGRLGMFLSVDES